MIIEEEGYGKDYESAEPTLKVARLLCMTLGISPSAMLGC